MMTKHTSRNLANTNQSEDAGLDGISTLEIIVSPSSCFSAAAAPYINIKVIFTKA